MKSSQTKQPKTTKKTAKLPIWLCVIIAIIGIFVLSNRSSKRSTNDVDQQSVTFTEAPISLLTNTPSVTATPLPTVQATAAPTATPTIVPTEVPCGQSMIEAFIGGYNQSAPNPITETHEFDITDKNSGHYRTEFRLSSFEGAYAQSGKIGDVTIDIVTYGYGQNDEIRIYADGLSLNQAVEIITYASPMLDAELSSDELQSVLAYINEHQEANGQFFGNLGLTLLGKYSSSYDLMIKRE